MGCGGSAASVDTARRRHRHVRKGAETEGKAGPGQDTTGHGASGGGRGEKREESARGLSSLHGSAEVRGALLRCVIIEDLDLDARHKI